MFRLGDIATGGNMNPSGNLSFTKRALAGCLSSKVTLAFITFKNSVRTSKRTPHFTITQINWLTLFKEVIAVYSENHTKPKLV
jgi:hypothetical protein